METTSERNHINIEDEMRRSYLDYAMSVIIGRALPDVRDGLKPVHRRVLWAMHELGNTYNKAYKKSARIVGDVIGKYHPHGDMPSTTRSCACRRTSRCATRLSTARETSDRSTAMQQRRCVTRKYAWRASRMKFLPTSRKRRLLFQPNYDESLSEPTVLPARVPNLLINGSDGIAVWNGDEDPAAQSHRDSEATLLLLKDPETTVQDLTKIVTGPDFPTGGFIYGREEIRNRTKKAVACCRYAPRGHRSDRTRRAGARCDSHNRNSVQVNKPVCSSASLS
jgi:DNA gyrase subunit A